MCGRGRLVAASALLLAARVTAQSARAPASNATEPVVTVRGLPLSVSPTELSLSGKSAAEGAGTQGDPVKALQSLPGLGRGGIGGGDFVAWGSEPRESNVEVDGVEVPFLYYGSGVRSFIHPALVESLSTSPGAFGPAHGRSVGGLVQIRSARPDPSARSVRLAADLLDASVVMSAPIEQDRSAALAAVRYGYIHRWLPELIPPELRGTYVVPHYWDGVAEWSSELRGGESLRSVALVSSSASASAIFASDPSLSRRERSEEQFGRCYLQYRSMAGDGAELEAVPFVGWDTSHKRLSFGERTSRLDVTALRYGLRARQRTRLSTQIILSLGFDASGTAASVRRDGSASVPRREGDPYPFGTSPGTGFARDEFRAHVLGVGTYVELGLHFGPAKLDVGLRFEPTLLEASRGRLPLGGLPEVGGSRLEALLAPRWSGELHLARSVQLFAAAGRYHQPPNPGDLGAHFGNPNLKPASATHLAFGEKLRLSEQTRIELSVFSKWLSGLAARNPDPSPRRSEALSSSGSGRAFGVELFARQGESAGFSGWLSATLSRSERRSAGTNYRLSDFDSPLVVALVAQQVLGVWRMGTRFRVASGLPRTPVVGAFFDLGSSSFQPKLGALNSARLPAFAQLDLRVDRRFWLGAGTSLDVYVDALNVLSRRNQEEVAYSSDFSQQGSISGLPPLAILGFKVEQ